MWASAAVVDWKGVPIPDQSDGLCKPHGQPAIQACAICSTPMCRQCSGLGNKCEACVQEDQRQQVEAVLNGPRQTPKTRVRGLLAVLAMLVIAAVGAGVTLLLAIRYLFRGMH